MYIDVKKIKDQVLQFFEACEEPLLIYMNEFQSVSIRSVQNAKEMEIDIQIPGLISIEEFQDIIFEFKMDLLWGDQIATDDTYPHSSFVINYIPVNAGGAFCAVHAGNMDTSLSELATVMG